MRPLLLARQGRTRKVEGVSSAEVSHETGLAVVKGEKLDAAALKTAIENQGFSVAN